MGMSPKSRGFQVASIIGSDEPVRIAGHFVLTQGMLLHHHREAKEKWGGLPAIIRRSSALWTQPRRPNLPKIHSLYRTNMEVDGTTCMFLVDFMVFLSGSGHPRNHVVVPGTSINHRIVRREFRGRGR